MTSHNEFVNWYYNDDDDFFITLINNKTGATSNFHHNKASYLANTSKIDYANEIAAKSVYFSINTFKSYSMCELNEYKQVRKTKSNVNNIKSIVFDFDEVETSAKDLENIVVNLGIPTYILETSPKKYQVCYKLNANDVEHRIFEIVNKSLAKFFRSDLNVCSSEKVFRLPFLINQKNQHKTKLLKFNPNITFDFEFFISFLSDLLKSNIEIREFYNDFYNKHIAPKPKKVKPKKIILNKTSTSKDTKIISTSSKSLISVEVNPKLISKYKKLLKFNNNDASIVDIHFIKARLKIVNNYDDIFNEIVEIRKILNKPIQRDLQLYYEDRHQFF